MAVIQESKTIAPTTINKFLGLNLSNTGDTQIQLGESGNMTNFYITDDYKLRKMFGYKCFNQYAAAIQGMFSAKLSGNKYFLVIANKNLYVFDGDALNNNETVNPEKTEKFTGDGETKTFLFTKSNNRPVASVESLTIGDSTITEFEHSGTTWTFPSTTVGEVTYPSGVISAADRIIFDENEDAPTEGTPIRIKYTCYFDGPNVSLTGGGDLGTSEASFFEFNNCVYILCGDYYKFYIDGSTTPATKKLVKVEGYIPKVFVNTPPAGGGVIYDEINILTGKKHQTFNPDGTATYQLAQKGISSVDKVIVDGVEKAVNTDYTANTTDGTVTFNNDKIPTSTLGYDSVDIYWTKNDGDRNIIAGMKFGTIFGGDVDTRVFMYGNPSCQNRVYFSGTTFENDIAVPSVEYFPATAQVDIGPSNFAVTDLTRQYDRLLATTNKPEAYYLTLSTEQLSVTLAGGETTTRYVPSVKTLPLNEAHGNVAMGQGQLIMNYPVTIEDTALILWKATNVRDEKNAEEISQKINLDLEKINISDVKTLDLQEKSQLWILYENKVWIYNYNNKTFSKLEFPDTMTHICSHDGNVFMSTNDNWLLKFDESFTDYDGQTIEAYWEMNFSDFGAPYLRKTMNRLWVLMQPQNWSSADVSFVTNLAESLITKHIEYKKQWFDNVNFNDFTFKSSINPQPFRLKLKAKKFTNMKLTIKNTEESACTILSLVLQVDGFGYSK